MPRRRASSPRITIAKVLLKPSAGRTSRLKRREYSFWTCSRTFSGSVEIGSFRIAVRAVPVYSTYVSMRPESRACWQM